jgi:hypothetical protein
VKRYGMLLGAALATALVLGLLARLPSRASSAHPAQAPVAEISLALVLTPDGISPAASAVPKDHRVRLEVSNRRAQPATLALAGYEERIPSHTLAPGETWRAVFVADLPGEDFAWLIDGRPAGRLSVTGSHLIEGHR